MFPHFIDVCNRYNDVAVRFGGDPRFKPKIIFVCGSKKFKDKIEDTCKAFTAAGHIVLSQNLYEDEVTDSEVNNLTAEEVMENIKNLSLRKVELCNYLYVVNTDGYIGKGTQIKIDYAKQIETVVILYEVNDFTKENLDG